MHSLIKPRKLSTGDMVATISLSWGGASLFPYRYEMGKSRLKNDFGLNVIETTHALKDPAWLSNNPKARADDLMEAFSNPDIKAIFSIIGGDDSIRLLPYIDYDVIKKNPKIFLGFSDATVTHFMCLKAGLSSFYGPAVMTAFAENVRMHHYTTQFLKKVLFSDEIIGELPPNHFGWTVEFLDWANPVSQQVLRKLNRPIPWQFISGRGKVKGRLIGGCIEVLQFMLGTEIWPSLNSWDETILFLETSEEGISPDTFESLLHNLAGEGILAKINGLLFSKPGGHLLKPAEFIEYDTRILKVLNEYGRSDLPVVTHVDFGHTDPMLTLPYGSLLEIDVDVKKLSILESGVV